MSLNKGQLKSAIEAAFRSCTPGEDSVSSLASKIADAIDTYIKAGVVMTTTSGGTCAYQPVHPPVPSTGVIR